MKVFFSLFICILFLAASVWFALWFFSSSSLASGFCNSNFSLFHEHFRCRQPYGIGFVVSFALFICLLFFRYRAQSGK